MAALSINTEQQLHDHLSQKGTAELIEIYRTHDTDEWRPEVFGVVAAILRERGVPLPSPLTQGDQDLVIERENLMRTFALRSARREALSRFLSHMGRLLAVSLGIAGITMLAVLWQPMLAKCGLGILIVIAVFDAFTAVIWAIATVVNLAAPATGYGGSCLKARSKRTPLISLSEAGSPSPDAAKGRILIFSIMAYVLCRELPARIWSPAVLAPGTSIGPVTASMVRLGISALLCWFLYRGRSWALWTVAICAGLSGAGFAFIAFVELINRSFAPGGCHVLVATILSVSMLLGLPPSPHGLCRRIRAPRDSGWRWRGGLNGGMAPRRAAWRRPTGPRRARAAV